LDAVRKYRFIASTDKLEAKFFICAMTTFFSGSLQTSLAVRYSLTIAAISFAFFVPFLGAVHLFDWDEINFAESAREMLVTGN